MDKMDIMMAGKGRTFMDRDALAKYTTDTGKILPRKYTGLTPMQQRKVSRLIKKARHMQILK